MKKLLILLLLALPLCAQTVHTFPALDTDNTFTGPNLFQLLQMYNRTVSQLSALSPKRNGLTELITDGSTTTDCTIGGGSNYVLCYYKTGDSTWHPYFSGLGALVSAEYLPPLFTTNCASPSTCEDIVFSPIAVSDSMVFGTPSTPTLGLPYPTNFSGAFNCEDYTSSLSSAVCPFNSAVSSGTTAVPHHLVACIQHDGGTVTDVSDTLGNTWTNINGIIEDCWIAHNTGNGADTVTFTLSAAASYAVSMYEEVGADAANPIDTKLGNGSGTAGTQTWTVTTAQPDGYTLTYSGGGAGGSGYQVVTSTATYTQDIQTTHYGGGGTGHSFISGVGWGQLSSTGAQSITTYCTALSGGTCTNVGLLLAFKPAGAGIPTYPNFLYLKYKHLVAGGDFPSISSGNAGQTLVVDPTGTKFTLGSAVSGGTVTSFSAGNLSPLFTTTVATATTTPALSFSLTNAAANTIFGNFTGSSGAPSYNAISACGDSTHALGWTAGTGFVCQSVTGSGGITSLNGDTSAAQTVTVTAPLTISNVGATHTVACPTCATSVTATGVGGIMGLNGTSQTGEFTPLGTDSAKFAMPFSAFHGNLGCYTTGSSANTYYDANFYSANGTYTNSAMDIGRAVLTQGSTGAFHEIAGMQPFYVAAENQLQLSLRTIGGSTTTPTAPSGCSWQTEGSTSQALGWDGNGAAAGASPTIEYIGPSDSRGSGGWTTTEANHFVPIPYASTAQNMKVWTNGSQSGTGNLVITLRITHAGSTSSSSVVTTIAASAVAGIYNSGVTTAAIAAGDLIDWQITCNASATCAAINSISMELVPSGSATGMIIFPVFGTFTTGSDRFTGAFYPNANKTSEADALNLMPRALTAKNLYCVYSIPPAVSATFTLRKNGADGALTVTIPTTGSGTQIISDTTHTVSYSQWDTFDMKSNQASGSSVTLQACSMEVD